MGTKNSPGKFDCYDKAEPDEPMFVLLARDPFAAYLVDLWADHNRQHEGAQSEKTAEAYACADAMRRWRDQAWQDGRIKNPYRCSYQDAHGQGVCPLGCGYGVSP